MIDKSVVCFPNNVVSLVALALADISPPSSPSAGDGIRVVQRPLRPGDDTETIGIYPGTWIPEADSHELGSREPTLQTYSISIEAMVHDVEEDRGIATHSLLSALVRHKIYRDQALKVALPQLKVNLGGVSEVVCNWGVNQQRFQNNKFGNSFYYLSTLDLWVKTDINAI